MNFMAIGIAVLLGLWVLEGLALVLVFRTADETD